MSPDPVVMPDPVPPGEVVPPPPTAYLVVYEIDGGWRWADGVGARAYLSQAAAEAALAGAEAGARVVAVEVVA